MQPNVMYALSSYYAELTLMLKDVKLVCFMKKGSLSPFVSAVFLFEVPHSDNNNIISGVINICVEIKTNVSFCRFKSEVILSVFTSG